MRTIDLMGGASVLLEDRLRNDEGGELQLATNQYPWITFYRREGKDFNALLDQGLGEVAQAGLQGFEPIFNNIEEVRVLAPLLTKHGLRMGSFYVNSTLHDSTRAEQSIEEVLAIATEARGLGATLVVTNPSPIRWGGPENKTDRQLRVQARALERLGRLLQAEGMTLAYHNHDIELRNAAREFHHMLLDTDPSCVSFCLDAHWIFRGSGDSNVALADVVKLYGSRVTELHVRQSVGGVWSESLQDGDIDYLWLAEVFAAQEPRVVLEQAVEEASPKTLNALEAHRESAAYARRVFAPLR